MLPTMIRSVLCITAVSFIAAFSANNPSDFTGVRFSLYPNVGKEKPPSLKQAVKTAVKGIDQLGLIIQPDDVSSCLLGEEPVLFEAVRSCFARASLTPDGNARGVSMQCTFSAGCPGEDLLDEFPERTVVTKEGKEFVDDAYLQPPRIAAQFAVYPMGASDYMDCIHEVIDHAKKSPVWKEGTTHFCSMLDGDGNEVFDLLQECFMLARKTTGHLVMTATLTANKNAWPEEDRSKPR